MMHQTRTHSAPRAAWSAAVTTRAASIAAASVLLLLIVCAAHAEQFGDLDITVDPPVSVDSWHGYAELSFRIVNHSPDAAHQVTLYVPLNASSSAGERLRRISRTVVVGPAAAARVRMYQPPLPVQGDRTVGIVIDGRAQPRRLLPRIDTDHMSTYYSYRSFGGSNRPVVALLSKSINRSDAENGFDRARPVSHRAGITEMRHFAQAELPPAAWSDHWLSYSRFDAVMLSSSDVDAMPQAVFEAIIRYVESGGTLIVLGRFSPPPHLGPLRKDGGAAVFEAGFGRVMVYADESADSLNDVHWNSIWESMTQTYDPYTHTRSVVNANRALPVVDSLSIPARGLLVLMLVFAVVIGPVNLLVLNRIRRRIWLLWTVPLISLLFCGAVFAYNIVAEGWTGHSVRLTMTLLDQRTHRATTIGWVGYYAPLTPGDGLRFSADTELTPHVELNAWQGGRARDIDWTEGQHLSGGWITARIPAHFMVRRSAVDRQRVQIQREADGGLSAINGLKTPIAQLWYAAHDGKLYAAENIAAGAKVALTVNDRKADYKAADSPDRFRRLYTTDWPTSFAKLADDPTPHLGAGQYAAITDTCAFVAEGLSGTQRAPAQNIIYGTLEEPAP